MYIYVSDDIKMLTNIKQNLNNDLPKVQLKNISLIENFRTKDSTYRSVYTEHTDQTHSSQEIDIIRFNSTCDTLLVDSTLCNMHSDMTNDDNFLSQMQEINLTQDSINLDSYESFNDYINVNSAYNNSTLNIINNENLTIKDNNIDFTLTTANNDISSLNEQFNNDSVSNINENINTNFNCLNTTDNVLSPNYIEQQSNKIINSGSKESSLPLINLDVGKF